MTVPSPVNHPRNNDPTTTNRSLHKYTKKNKHIDTPKRGKMISYQTKIKTKKNKLIECDS